MCAKLCHFQGAGIYSEAQGVFGLLAFSQRHCQGTYETIPRGCRINDLNRWCRLMDDARFAWLILVPRRAGMRELIDLAAAEQHMLLDEIARCAAALRDIVAPDKLNIAALGNVVAQLHVHVIARRHGDAAWPRPVWGAGTREGYARAVREDLIARLRAALSLPATA